MNTLPTVTRVCARRTTHATKPSPKSSTSITARSKAPRFQSDKQLPYRSITTSSHSTQTDPNPIDLSSLPSNEAASTATTPSLPSSMSKSQPESSSTLPTSSPYLITGTVTRANTMTHCVQVTRHGQMLDRALQKHYTRPIRTHVHDPNPQGYLREGDVIEFGPWSPSERAARLERKAAWEEKEKTDKIAADEQRVLLQQQQSQQQGGGQKKGKPTVATRRWGSKKIERTKFRGPKYVVRRVVTPFETPLDARMEGLVEGILQGKDADVTVVQSRKGNRGKQQGRTRTVR